MRPFAYHLARFRLPRFRPPRFRAPRLRLRLARACGTGPALAALAALAIGGCAGGSPAPPGDPIEALLRRHHEHRVHHVLGRAEPFVATFADTLLNVADGRVSRTTRAAARDRFARYFAAARFLEWEDVAPPIIRVAPAGDAATVVVEKRVRLAPGRGDAQPAATRFAWTGSWRRDGGEWRLLALASTDRPEPDDPPAPPGARARAHDILHAARAAIGGDAAAAAVATLELDADCRSPRGPYRTRVRSARDGRFRFAQEFPDRPPFAIGRSLDGPWILSGDAATADSLSAFQRFLAHAHEFHLLAIAPEARFRSPRALTHDAAAGDAAAVVRFFHPDTGTPVDFLFDPGSGRPRGFRIPTPPGPDPRPILTLLDDWRTTGDVALPFTITILQGDDRFDCHVRRASTAWLTDPAFRPGP